MTVVVELLALARQPDERQFEGDELLSIGHGLAAVGAPYAMFESIARDQQNAMSDWQTCMDAVSERYGTYALKALHLIARAAAPAAYAQRFQRIKLLELKSCVYLQ